MLNSWFQISSFPFGLVQRRSSQNIHVCKDVSIYGGTNSNRAELGYKMPIKNVVGYNQIKPQSYLIEFYDSLEQGRLLFQVELSIVTRATRSNDSLTFKCKTIPEDRPVVKYLSGDRNNQASTEPTWSRLVTTRKKKKTC